MGLKRCAKTAVELCRWMARLSRAVLLNPDYTSWQEPQGTSDFRLRSQGPCRLGTGESGLVVG